MARLLDAVPWTSARNYRFARSLWIDEIVSGDLLVSCNGCGSLQFGLRERAPKATDEFI